MEEKAGSVEEADKNLSKSSFLLPLKDVFQLTSIGYLTGSAYGFIIYYQNYHHVSGAPWRTLLSHGLQFGQQLGGRTALWPVMMASVEHGMETSRGKRDPLNSFMGGVSLGGYIAYTYRCPPVKGAIATLGLGSLYGLGRFLTAPAPESPSTTVQTM